MLEIFIAKKHILERKKQSLIAILGIMIGITVLTVSVAISNGLDNNMIKNILSLSSHVVVSDFSGDIENYDTLTQNIQQIQGVKGVIPKVYNQGIVKFNNGISSYASGAEIIGLDFEKAKKYMHLKDLIVEGSMDFKKPKVLVGKEFANQLGVVIGDKINLVSAENQELILEVGGIFQSGYYRYDLSMVIVPLQVAQILKYSGNKVSTLEVILNNPYDAEKLSPKIFEKTNLSTRTWGELNQNLLKALALEKTVMIIVFSLIVVIAGFVVWVILNMLVREKIKDIGILRSMGFSKNKIMKIFLIEGITLGGIGSVIGILLSFFILWYLKNFSLSFITKIYYLKELPVAISLKEILIILLANILIIFLSSIFPALRASKLNPVEALKYE